MARTLHIHISEPVSRAVRLACVVGTSETSKGMKEAAMRSLIVFTVLGMVALLLGATPSTSQAQPRPGSMPAAQMRPPPIAAQRFRPGMVPAPQVMALARHRAMLQHRAMLRHRMRHFRPVPFPGYSAGTGYASAYQMPYGAYGVYQMPYGSSGAYQMPSGGYGTSQMPYGGYGSSPTSDAYGYDSSSTGTLADADQLFLATVALYDNSFQPKTTNVSVGTTVQWVNLGRHSHTVTSDRKGWDSGTLRPGDVFSYTFNRPGRYAYHCALHPQEMHGVVVVQEATSD
jgi:plastocyanin